MAKKTAKRIKPVKPAVETKSSKTLLLVLLALSYILYVTWSQLSHSTWDDDCATRYFRTLNAFRDPYEFIHLWNRPLFVVVFAAPVAVAGKLAIPLLMSAISAAGAYFLYQSARLSGYKFAWLAIPFMLFQPFFLGTGRDAMTEPMAATIIAWGLYAALTNRWLLFSILGAILPLARTELALLLPFWAYVLFRAKRLSYIPILAAGVVVWNLAGWAIAGDPLYIFHQTIDKADEENRYGNQPFLTYFNRYMYVVGPVVFYFFLLGLVRSMLKLEFKPLVLLQFLTGFLLYTVLAWKISIGQSAGFLRNLIPLSPLAAFIAVYGFEFFADSVIRQKHKLLLFFLAVGIGLLTIFVYPYELTMHHTISKTKQFDFLNIGIAGGLTVLVGMAAVMSQYVKEKQLKAIAIFIGLLTTGYALYTEPPDANLNSEREMFNRIVECYQDSGLEDAPQTLCSHGWFHWVGDYVAFREGSKFLSMTKDNLEAAPVGSVIIWESHYSNRLGNNINLSDLADATKYTLLGTFLPDDATKVAHMYMKKDPEKSIPDILDPLIAKNPKPIEFLMQRANYYMSSNNAALAKEDLDRALELAPDNNNVKINMATYLIRSGQHKEAIALTNEIIADNKDYLNAYVVKGNAFFSQNDYTSAVGAFNEILSRNKDNKEAHYNIGVSYIRLNRIDDACRHLQEAKRLKMTQADQLITQYCNKPAQTPGSPVNIN